MMRKSITIAFAVSILAAAALSGQSTYKYSWKNDYNPIETPAKRILPPEGYVRVELKTGSFGDWLRHIPLKPGRPPVYLHNGKLKSNQAAHYAVIDMDVGKRDLQQCADAIMRVRAEYLYSIGDYDAIHFNFTSGFNFRYDKWRAGYTPKSYKKGAGWRKSSRVRHSYGDFMSYMTLVFSYAGTHSLSLELDDVKSISDMRPGDLFIQGGFPGHAILVVDMAQNPSTGKKVFMLAQSFMPAQEMHILENPTDPDMSPWYPLDFGETLYTPEWRFQKSDLKRFSS